MLYVKIVNEKPVAVVANQARSYLYPGELLRYNYQERAIVKNAAKRRLPQCSYVSPALLLSPQRCSKRAHILWSTTVALSSLN